MKKWSIALVGLLALVALANGDLQTPLEKYIETDLRELGQKEQAAFWNELSNRSGISVPKPRSWPTFFPWWVKPFKQDEAAWMFLEIWPGDGNPSDSAIRIHIFDETWDRLSTQVVPTGYRIYPSRAELRYEPMLGETELVVRSYSTGPFLKVNETNRVPIFEQGQYQEQHYAILKDEFVLVRLDDDQGRLVRNHYRWSAPPKGPPVPSRTQEEWISSLGSSNVVEQLAALAWLTGDHLPSSEEREIDHNQESIEDSHMVEAVRNDPRTQHILRELKGHKVKWLREYADLRNP